MTPEERTQWIIVAFLVALLVAALVIGSRCERQDGDTTAPALTTATASAALVGGQGQGPGVTSYQVPSTHTS